MRAVTWQGKRSVAVQEWPDPTIEVPTDAIIRVTSTAICGSDLHLYEVLGAYMGVGDILGHEAMGIVEQVGSNVQTLRAGDRVVVPFNIACGACWMCTRGLFAQCEVTQVRAHDKGAAIYGYSRLYGSVPGGQAELLRVPYADVGPVKVGHEAPDERYLYLSDVLPTAWQAVDFAEVPVDGTLAVVGLGPIGQAAVRIARHLGIEQVIGIDLIPERLEAAAAHGANVIDAGRVSNVGDVVRDRTGGRGADGVVEAVGMEAHGSGIARAMHQAVGFMPDPVARRLMESVGVDRLAALYDSIDLVRRGGTVSIAGVYGGAADPLPMLQLFDKGVQLRMGQCHVRRWIDDLLPLVEDDTDPLDTASLATHRLDLDDAPSAYEMFQAKSDGCIKVVLRP